MKSRHLLLLPQLLGLNSGRVHINTNESQLLPPISDYIGGGWFFGGLPILPGIGLGNAKTKVVVCLELIPYYTAHNPAYIKNTKIASSQF